jgi:hypothetical protein
MQIDFQLPVVTYGTPKGQKKSRQVVATAPVEVNVREVRSCDTIPVASVSYPPGTPQQMTEYVSIDGTLYVRLNGAFQFSASFALYGSDPISFAFSDVDRFVRLSVDNGVYNGNGIYPAKLAKERKAREPLSLSPFADLGLETFGEETVERQIASFLKRCERLVVVDGAMLAHVAEPVLAVELIDRQIFKRASIYPLARSFKGLASRKSVPQAVFRLDEVDRLFDFCVAAGVDRSALSHWNPARVAIHDGFRLSLQTERASLYSAAARLTKRAYGAPWLPDHQLVDDVFQIVKDYTEENFPDELGDVLAGIIELHRSGTKVFDVDFELELADHVLRMWDDRKIDVAPVQSISVAP